MCINLQVGYQFIGHYAQYHRQIYICCVNYAANNKALTIQKSTNVQVIHVKMEAPVRMKSTAIIVNVPLDTQDICVKLVSVVFWLCSVCNDLLFIIVG